MKFMSNAAGTRLSGGEGLTQGRLPASAQWSVANFGVVGTAMAALLVGSAVPDERFMLAGVALSPVVFVLCACVAMLQRISLGGLSLVALSFAALGALGLTLNWSGDAEYGAYKLLNLYLSAWIAFVCLAGTVERWGIRPVVVSIWVILVGLLLVTTAYKLQAGFLDRYVPFLLFGPIVFARLMGIGLVLSLFIFSGPLRLLWATAFAASVVWTASKGPLLAAVLTVVIWGVLEVNSARQALARMIFAGTVVGAALYFINQLGLAPADVGRLGVLLTLSGGGVVDGGATDSISARYWLAVNSLELIASHPLGVGLGGWATEVSESYGLAYPHNLLLELWSEGGLLLGSVATLPFLAFVVARGSPWKYLALLFFLSQLVSGDLLDARYLLVFSLLSILGLGSAPGVAVGAASDDGFGKARSGAEPLPVRRSGR